MRRTLWCVIALMTFSAPAFAVNLVANGGFETGNFANWTQSGDTGFTGVDNFAVHSGSYAAFFGPVNSTGFITQTLATTAGESYDLSFYLKNDDSFNDNFFGVWWDGIELGSFTNLDSFDWTEGVSGAPLVASSNATELTFGFYNPPSYFYLDDVVVESAGVAPVPEPTSLVLLGGGLLAGAVVLRRRRRTHLG